MNLHASSKNFTEFDGITYDFEFLLLITMIQRRQTLWLFLAALLSATLMLNWYTGYVYQADIAQGFGIVVKDLSVRSHFPTLIIAVVMTLLPLITIFMFKNRKQQRGMVAAGLLACFSFIGVNLMRINNFNHTTAPAPANGSYQLGSVIPVVVVVFLILALRGISKDEKLVKSMDRLR